MINLLTKIKTEKSYDVREALSGKRSYVEKFNLSYLGEFLERGVDRGLTVKDILSGILENYDVPVTIHKGQFEVFKKHFKSYQKENEDMNVYLSYLLLLDKLDKQSELEKELKTFISSLKLDETFMLFLLYVERKLIDISSCREAIIEKLNSQKFNISFVTLAKKMTRDICNESEYGTLNRVTKILELKPKDFENKDKFKAIKSLNYLATNQFYKVSSSDLSLVFEDSQMDIISLLNIKLCNEKYVEGSSRRTANANFYKQLNSSINPEREEFYLLANINSIDNCSIDFSDVDIELSEDRYEDICLLMERVYLTYSNISKVNLDTFLTFIEGKVSPNYLSHSIAKLLFSIISDGDISRDELERCFQLFKSTQVNISTKHLSVFFQKNLYTLKECINSVKSNYCDNVVDFVNLLSTEAIIDLSRKIISNEIEINFDVYSYLESTAGHYRSSCRCNVLDVIEKKIIEAINKDNLSDTIAVESIKLLHDLTFLNSDVNIVGLENRYNKFIFDIIISDTTFAVLAKKALFSSDDEIKDVAKFMLEFDVSDHTKHGLNKLAYSEEEANLIALRKDVDELVNDLSHSRWYNGCHSSTIKKIGDLNDDLKLEFTNKILDSLSNSSLNISGYIELLISLYKNNCISANKRDSFVLDKVHIMSN